MPKVPRAISKQEDLIAFARSSEDDHIKAITEAILQVRRALGPDIDGACEVASQLLADALRARSFLPVILEGEIPLGPNHWLEHRVVVLELSTFWIVADLAAAQVPRLSDVSFLIVVTAPNPVALRTALATYYAWWSA